MERVIRLPADVGLLSNNRLALEIGVGLAHLGERSLSMPFDLPIAPAPVPTVESGPGGRPSTPVDLWEIPVPVVPEHDWAQMAATRSPVELPWPDLAEGVFVHPHDADRDDPVFHDFANGRRRILSIPPDLEAAPALEITSRPLATFGYFFYARGEERRRLHDVVRKVRPRSPYRRLADRVARRLGDFNATHIRRSDLLKGIPAYRRVTPGVIAANLASVLPTDEPLLVCSELESDSEVFGPLRRRFGDVVFMNDLVLGSAWRSEFLDLPRNDSSVLGLVSQEVATAARRFVGTIGSTFTAIIQRQRAERDPTEPFLFTADYTPDGPRFERCAYLPIHEGRFSWNRVGYAMAPEVLSWFREWPEAAAGTHGR